MIHIVEDSATKLYLEALQRMRVSAVEEQSERGPVMTIQEPVLLELRRPTQRLITCPVRHPNPFFHMMEFIWMMAGSDDVRWIEQFNSNLRKSADGNIINGAYGHRWRWEWDVDQLMEVCTVLKKNPASRRAVLTMWDPDLDLGTYVNDRPCNTHIYFRVVSGALDMLVCNRSNDLIWGALGANIVHMTMLHEVIAQECKLELGTYRVISNNLHIYTDLPNYKALWDTRSAPDIYEDYGATSPILEGTNLRTFLKDCEYFIAGKFGGIESRWVRNTAVPAYRAYMERKEKRGDGLSQTTLIGCQDWRTACLVYIRQKETS